MGSKKKVAKVKPLDKMTAKELRDYSKEIPEIVGAHGMNKPELISAIKKAKGISEDAGRKVNTSVREVKTKIKKFKAALEGAVESKDLKMTVIFRRRISRLKKKTRRAA